MILALAVALSGCAGADPGTTSTTGSAPSNETPNSSGAPDTGAPATEEAGRRIAVSIGDGRVSGDTGRVPVVLGETVTLVVTSDTADEVHVHGYDLSTPVAADRPATLTVTADVPGVFGVELHEAGTVLLSLQVG
jgi:hypothetical protein